MRSVTYSMGVSLDGYIVGPDRAIIPTAPDEEVFRFVTEEIREVGVHLLGRRLYETMLYWETDDRDPSFDESELEWAAAWKPLPKNVLGFDFLVQESSCTHCLAMVCLLDSGDGRFICDETSAGIYVDRIAGGDCHHCGPCQPLAPCA